MTAHGKAYAILRYEPDFRADEIFVEPELQRQITKGREKGPIEIKLTKVPF